MKPQPERPLGCNAETSARPAGDDRRQMPACLSAVTPMRKEEAWFIVCAAAHIIDGSRWKAPVEEL